MPSAIIHEEVGYFIGKKYNMNSYDYYLGLIAPDAPNNDGFAPKEERWIAHQRSNDFKEWKDNLKKFYQKERNNYSKDFILGYTIHILTDIIFDEYLYSIVKEKIENDRIPSNISHNIMSQDMQKYYFEEIEMIKEILKNNKTSYDILDIPKDLLIKWKEKQFILWGHRNECIYINNNIINNLNNKVLEELNKIINY